MDSRTFDPVKVYFVKPEQTQIVTSARKAGELHTDDRWPVRGTKTQEKAAAIIHGALNGKGTPAAVRKAFVAAAAEAGLLLAD